MSDPARERISDGQAPPPPSLTEALLTIAAAPDRESMLRVTTEQAQRIIGAHQAVTSLTIDASWSQAITTVCLSEKYARWRTYDEPSDGSGIYALVCRTNRPMRLTQVELEQHPAWRAFGASADRHPPMRGWLAAPLVARDGRNFGLIQLSDKYQGEFTVEDETALSQLARLASIAIERANAEEALRASLVELQAKETRLHELAQQLVVVREDERKRLSFDLHDDVCQELVGIGILVEAVRSRLDADAAEAAPELGRVVTYVAQLVEHLHTLAGDLRPMQLRDLGLEASLRSLAVGASSSALPVVATFATAVPRLAEAEEIATYRIAQEALSNALRHARAGSVALSLAVAEGELCLEVRDDGVGFDVAHRPARALGIASMEERALAAGGRLELASLPARGTTVRFTCPLAARPRRAPAEASA